MLLTTVGLRKAPSTAGKRRLDARPGALALQAFDQAGLLAADVGPGPAVQVDVEVEVLAEDVLAEQVGRVGLVDRLLHDCGSAAVFVAEVDVGRAGPRRVAGEDDPFEDLVRVLLHQDAVVERARLALVGVDAQVDRARMVLGQEGPLDAARESRRRRGRAARSP